ncbi:MAG: hypothetical protein ACFFEF_01455 [Candidatus Thorarchaeota archaeon]
MNLGLSVNVHETVEETVQRSITLDKEGIDSLWIVDFPGSRFAPPVAAKVAMETNSRIGLGLLSPLLYRTDYIVQVIETLSSEYGDRFDLMIGAGDRNALQRIGINDWIPAKVVERVYSATREIRELLDEKGIECTVWIGAQGPKMIETSLSADGVLLNLADTEMIDWAISHLEERTSEFQLGAFIPSFIAENRSSEQPYEFLFSAAIVALGAPRSLLRKFDLLDGLRDAQKLFRQKGILDREVFNMIDPLIIRRFGLFGIPDCFADYIERIESLGLHTLVLGPPVGNRMEGVIELLQKIGKKKHVC